MISNLVALKDAVCANGWLTLGTILIFLVFLNYTQGGPDLRHIPAFGPQGRLTSYIGSYRFLSNACGVVAEEVNKHPAGMFRVPFLDHWEVVVSGTQLVNELSKASDDDLSVIDAVADVLQTEFTMGESIKYDQYHVGVIGSTLTRNLVAQFDDVYDEIAVSCEDVMEAKGEKKADGWVSVPLFDTVIDIVARTGNRLFVGLPLCRNRDYLHLARNWAVDVFIGAFFINFMPWILKPMRQRIVALRRRYFRHPGKDELHKTVNERVQLDLDFGTDRPDRPSDAISWMYDVARFRYSPDVVVDEVVQRIMFLNFSAIHTSTHALTNIIYHLAARPEIYLDSLRREVEEVTSRLGWTKAALREMIKVDSFVRESERFNGLSCLIMTRKVVNPLGFTFSNGVSVPFGAIVSVANYATHHNEDYYHKANEFDGFRFSDIREAAEGFDTIRHQMVHTTPEHVTFGHGRHSCPGRFFAANELKAALAHIVLFYDIKLGDNCHGVKPPNHWLSIALIPDKRAHVMFKRRSDVETVG
ncbi:cytochrome P450 [Mycena rosella]|uniref:Cytochrome P450 n=1 Tax=Mycena rosella TaxID=1033263 RepID=A0AAD7DN50_MYCRO|nr:cytochrome P450 [Mycena rosella]